MAAQIGFVRWDSGQRLACRGSAGIGCGPGASVTYPAGLGGGGSRRMDMAGLSWTSWDMIQNLRRADQARPGITDATRTERGFHAAGNGEIAGQRVFRWAGMGSL